MLCPIWVSGAPSEFLRKGGGFGIFTLAQIGGNKFEMAREICNRLGKSSGVQ